MAETRLVAPLLRLVDNAGGKAILVGDPGQLPAVGAGGLFAALCDRLGAVKLTQSRRQLDAQERAALARLRTGDPEPYLAHAAAHGRLRVEDHATEAKRRLLEDWWQAAASDLARTVMLAYRRGDALDLNAAARSLMSASGRLGEEALSLGEREFRVGDRIICRRNDARFGVRNGLRGTVVELDPSEATLALETDAGARRLVPASYATQHLEHAYALTGHAAQGATVERAFVLLRDGGALREWSYVACSRARTETRLYVVGDVRECDHHGRSLDVRDPTTRLAGALERSAAEQLALAQRRPDTTAVSRRAVERFVRQREQALARVELRLSTAEKKLGGLGRLRRRRSAELHAEVSLQRAAVRLARKQLASMSVEPPEPPPAPTLRRTVERPNRGRVHELDRGRELDL